MPLYLSPALVWPSEALMPHGVFVPVRWFLLRSRECATCMLSGWRLRSSAWRGDLRSLNPNAQCEGRGQSNAKVWTATYGIFSVTCIWNICINLGYKRLEVLSNTGLLKKKPKLASMIVIPLLAKGRWNSVWTHFSFCLIMLYIVIVIKQKNHQASIPLSPKQTF